MLIGMIKVQDRVEDNCFPLLCQPLVLKILSSHCLLDKYSWLSPKHIILNLIDLLLYQQ